MLLKDYGEIDLLKKIAQYSEVEKIGHDAADLNVSSDKITLITTDMMAEGIHFHCIHEDMLHEGPNIPTDIDSCFEIGFKAIAVNVSDIDAEGGVPKEALVSLCVNKNADISYIERFYNGINEAAKYYGIKIVGGDLINTLNGVVISIVLTGEVENDLRLTRKGAKPGNNVYVTGPLGESSQKNYKISFERLKKIGKKGRIIAQNKLANAMTDISDGLGRSLYDLYQQSNVGFKIYENKIPLATEASLDNALNGGEDFELLFTSDQDLKKDYHYIGKVIDKPKIVLVNDKGKEQILRTFGYNQFN